jgi:excisionase family DNA binding protein
MKLKDVYTTGEVAKLLKVTTNTVAKWFDAGMLKGFTNPGSSARRITGDELGKFISKHDIPLKRLQKEPFLTTAQCAKLCYVTTNTATKWIDIGSLPGFSLGTVRRLVFYRDLVRFMKDNKIPLIELNKFKPGEKKPRKKSTNGRRKHKKRKPGRPKKRGRPRKR